jgi:NADPH-dependent curcumin reductase
MDRYQQIVLASRPTGAPVAENFRLESGPTPVLADGAVLVRARYLSLDPYMRGRMSAAKSYSKPVEIGEPMEGETVAEVVESRHLDYRPGDLVRARSGWRTHAAISVEGLRRVDPALASITTALGVLGMPGFTAYSGMKVMANRKPVRRSSSRRQAARSARSSASSRNWPAPAPSESPAGRRSARMSVTSSTSMP